MLAEHNMRVPYNRPNDMAFDDRRSEWLTFIALVGMTVAVSVPALQAFGCEGWRLWLSVIACIAVTFLLLNGGGIVAWVNRKIHLRR